MNDDKMDIKKYSKVIIASVLWLLILCVKTFKQYPFISFVCIMTMVYLIFTNKLIVILNVLKNL